MVQAWTGIIEKEKIYNEEGKACYYRRNRTEDKQRSKEIKHAIINNDNIPVTFLQISIIEKNGIKLYKCWDGQHRRSAIKMLQNNSMVDSTIKNKFKCIVYKNDTSDGIKKKFININKSVPVPSVIIERLENEIKGETSMNKYEKIYKADQLGETAYF